MIPRGRILFTERRVHVGAETNSEPEPQVDLLRDSAGVRSIRIQCRCGEVLCLDLDYGSKAA